jgi:Uma2 family endonuclease
MAIPMPKAGFLTVVEFMKLDLDDRYRWELIDGEPVAHAAPRPAHGRIQARLSRFIGNRLDELNAAHGTDCLPVTEAGIPTPLDRDHNFRVADIAVTCEPHDPDDAFTRSPILLIEILSPGEETRQRAKLQMFAALPSVREILFVDSMSIRAELHRRNADGSWPPHPLVLSDGDILTLETVGLEVPLVSLYAGLNLS